VGRLNGFASEVTRVAREVGTDGKLGGQAEVRGVAGVWKDLTESVNQMASNLTSQVRNIAEVTTAVASGDLSRKITVDVKGEILDLSNTINTMVDQLNGFASEVTRVAREVGTDGKLGGQAEVRGVAGVWKDLTESVNLMASNLTAQVRNIAEVSTAIANGDLSRKITVDVKGEILDLSNTINTMVDQLNAFSSEVTRVAREVGTDGKLGGQAAVPGVAGVWKDLTENVNSMASNLTSNIRNIAEVTTAVATGDLARKITVDVKGEILELKKTINTMVDQLNGFASEVTRVAREVGTDGKLGGQAAVPGVAGVWKDLTDSVNLMASNLTGQVRNIAEVTTAVANGDLSRKITVDVQGEILALKNTMNTMVEQLRSFASEVTRVAREVGTEGKLGGQGQVAGVAGVWKDLTESVNSMASNLTGQVRNIAEVTTAVASGDLSRKIAVDVRGEFLQLKDTINTMVDQLRAFAAEVTRVAREVGNEGRLGGQAYVPGVAGTWKDLTESVNSMAANLTGQVRNIAAVTTAVANGDLSKTITVEARGEILELKNTINTMVGQLNSFASEVTRVAREVGTEGKLGGQARMAGVAGVWKDLTDNVNLMAANLTEQVRGIALVVTAVANGNLRQSLTLQARGEIAELVDTINSMIQTLATFGDQVTSVAREVGVEGKLGGQAAVPGAAGLWKDLVDNVNQLAANLTTQVRAIADVATAVTQGNLTRSIQVEASGEVAVLKDNINAMIRNLRETTGQNTEQDWLKSNLTRFTRLLQGERDILTVGQSLLTELCPLVSAQHGVFYIAESAETKVTSGATGAATVTGMKLLASYGFQERKNLSSRWRIGEGLVGQCAFEKKRILLTNVPADYIQITSGLGQASPLNIVVIPILFEGSVKAVIELASFERYGAIHLSFLDQMAEGMGILVNTIEAGARTEDLLKQSQALGEKLQSQQDELRATNEELEDKAQLLARQNTEVERKNREIDLARASLEEKAEQIALTSKYKSEFLANMSHELRTPLNSLLLLAQQLTENAEGNLTGRQVEFARTIHGSGQDLLNLINDILDLSKIESGTVTVDLEQEPFEEFARKLERTFRHVAESKGLGFGVDLAPELPESFTTDPGRLQQVLKNLLSNAFKFTSQGRVDVRVGVARAGWSREHASLNNAATVFSFAVTDTGIGIPKDKQKVIFEAFQQADTGTSRKYGGAGLGLAISREIAALLGGEIRLESVPGQGSTFTLFLPAAAEPTGGKPQRNLIHQTAWGNTSARGEGEKAVLPAWPAQAPGPVTAPAERISDDQAAIRPGDRVLLIIEDDLAFARSLLDIARQSGFKGIVAGTGQEGLDLLMKHPPTAITLDLHLPDMDGLALLDRLKSDLATLHIPVHIISVEDDRMRGLARGAFGYLTKPVRKEALQEAMANIQKFIDSPVRQLLLVEDEASESEEILKTLAGNDIQVTAVATAAEALRELRSRHFDCMILDLRLPDMSGVEILKEMARIPEIQDLPVLVHTAAQLGEVESAQLRSASRSVIVKGVRSGERLLAEASLFLHRVAANMPEQQRRILEGIYRGDTSLHGKKILCVDDDARNLFALAAVLERYRVQVRTAETGKQALEMLEKEPDTDAVLMDIMMPEMDGYETMRRIRSESRFRDLPILALTAKAMKGDREKCIEAGASDYLAKPIDQAQLMTLLRVWLYD